MIHFQSTEIYLFLVVLLLVFRQVFLDRPVSVEKNTNVKYQMANFTLIVALLLHMFGLSKERPILRDHPKAHIHEIRQISHEIHLHVKSTYKPYKSNNSRKTPVL